VFEAIQEIVIISVMQLHTRFHALKTDNGYIQMSTGSQFNPAPFALKSRRVTFERTPNL